MQTEAEDRNIASVTPFVVKVIHIMSKSGITNWLTENHPRETA
jgi:hypothetical protein